MREQLIQDVDLLFEGTSNCEVIIRKDDTVPAEETTP